LCALGKGRLGIYATDRYFRAVGNNILLRGSDNIIGKRNILGCHNKNNIGICFLGKIDSLLCKIALWNLMDLIFYIILDEIFNGKGRIDFCFLRIFLSVVIVDRI